MLLILQSCTYVPVYINGCVTCTYSFMHCMTGEFNDDHDADADDNDNDNDEARYCQYHPVILCIAIFAQRFVFNKCQSSFLPRSTYILALKKPRLIFDYVKPPLF